MRQFGLMGDLVFIALGVALLFYIIYVVAESVWTKLVKRKLRKK